MIVVDFLTFFGYQRRGDGEIVSTKRRGKGGGGGSGLCVGDGERERKRKRERERDIHGMISKSYLCSLLHNFFLLFTISTLL